MVTTLICLGMEISVKRTVFPFQMDCLLGCGTSRFLCSSERLLWILLTIKKLIWLHLVTVIIIIDAVDWIR